MRWMHCMLLAGLLLAGGTRARAAAPASSPAASAPAAAKAPTLIVVIGAPGTPEYGEEFLKSADQWAAAAKRAGATYVEIGRSTETRPAQSGKTQREELQALLTQQASDTASPLWLVLIGHGTFDGKEAKFNLRDLDFSDQELATWLKPITRPLAVIDCSSGSAPFLNRISGPNRVVITSTRAGTELNYSRFGVFLSAAIADPAADLDRDGQTSLLEAFLAASRRVADFYKDAGRLATEHALLDDNGDGLGVSADWFDGTRATRSARTGAPVDGARARQWALLLSDAERALPADVIAKRNAIELKIEALRARRAGMLEQDYYAQLDALCLSLARLYQQNEPGK